MKYTKSIRTKEHEAFMGLILKARKDAGLSQQQVADAMGWPQTYVSKVELGERRLDVIEFIKMADVIGFSKADFLDTVKSQTLK